MFNRVIRCTSRRTNALLFGRQRHQGMPYTIYVIELSKKVFNESAKFRAANPQFHGVLECLYVGMTSKTPQERFDQHRSGTRSKKGHNLSSSIVKKYGRYLRPSLYNHIKPLKTRAEALKAEARLALELRRKRYAVWYNWLKCGTPIKNQRSRAPIPKGFTTAKTVAPAWKLFTELNLWNSFEEQTKKATYYCKWLIFKLLLLDLNQGPSD